MTATPQTVRTLFDRRDQPVLDFARQAGAVADACHEMARRFHQGGKLIVFGTGAAAADAQHVAVEFVHPVIVGKRALPAIALTCDVATLTGIAASDGLVAVFSRQLRHLAAPADIALGIGDDPAVAAGLSAAQELGLLTIALCALPSAPADHVLLTPSPDALIVKELRVTAYHLLWELVHVFFEQPGVLAPEVIA